MTTRRDHRQTHVRPRPPSTGRPAPVKVKQRAPASTRLVTHRPINRGNGMPWIFRIALIAAVLALGAGVLYVGARGLGVVVGGVGSTLGGFVQNVTSTPAPTPVVDAISLAPTLDQPSEPYTSEAAVDLVVTVPASLVGDKIHRIRLYLALPDQQAAAIKEVPIADTTKTVIPGIELTDGINDFSVSITGPGGESDKSAVVRYVFDDVPPKITITSPKNNAVVNGKAVAISGKTQARTTLVARNDANGSSVAGTAESDGSFLLSVAIASGVNQITVIGTDPAGNVAQSILNIRRGTGKLAVSLGASVHEIKRSKLPEPVTLTATVTDPDGHPLAAADVTFTLSMPGIPTVSIDGTTGDDGRATFKTTVPKGADIGQGSATVLVTTKDFGSAQDYAVISIVK
jgi:Glucodextranase, domain B/Bacterial Ig-like domain (group 1)